MLGFLLRHNLNSFGYVTLGVALTRRNRSSGPYEVTDGVIWLLSFLSVV